MLYFKITNKEENHHGFQYVDGLNVLDKPFEEEGSCVEGGLYFSDAENILKFLPYGIYLREITLPVSDPDFKMVQDPGNRIKKWRANKIILGKKYNLSDVSTYKYLISLGADIQIHNASAIKNASCNGYLEVVQFLVEYRGLHYKSQAQNGEKVETGLINNRGIEHAARFGHLEIVRFLVEKCNNTEANINAAIEFASYRKHFDIVLYLAENGANIQTDDYCPLRMAVKHRNLELVRYLMGKGGNVNAKNHFAMATAILNNDLDMVKFLIENGANRYEAIVFAKMHTYDRKTILEYLKLDSHKTFQEYFELDKNSN